MQSLFEKNIIRMKSELRDLKTAQKRASLICAVFLL